MELSSEAELVSEFVNLLRAGESPWGDVGIVQEFSYVRGRTDIVITTQEQTIAVEAKLLDWRRALDQAYRNTCFAELSFVLLPERRAYWALQFSNEFEMRGVGICCIVDGQLELLVIPKSSEPLEPWLTEKVRQLAIT